MPVGYRGVIPPIVTPFHEDGSVDEQALRDEVDFHLSVGVNGLCVTGTSGEGHALNKEDSAEIARIAVDQVADRVPVIAGIIQNSTSTSVEYAEAIAETGVHGLQITPVHYLFKPGTDETVYHYRTLADCVGLPLVIYNVVPWSMVEVPALLELTREVPEVVSVKQSGGDLHKVADLLWALPEQTTILSAVDDLLYPAFTIGAHGSVSGTSSIAPQLVIQLWEAVQNEDHATARDIHRRLLPLWRAVEGSNMNALMKEAITLQGRKGGYARRPINPVTPAQRERLKEAVQLAGLLDPALA
ncbi:dihydrodipicolinate synthase family protein [Microbacterium sp. NPDC055910]|uniref:dihydrodipicolinate synthase family protein n=1 Tax=Microbacterium sp. NPDC055910 TaxID=3345659 RepID=UPI0035D8CDF8